MKGGTSITDDSAIFITSETLYLSPKLSISRGAEGRHLLGFLTLKDIAVPPKLKSIVLDTMNDLIYGEYLESSSTAKFRLQLVLEHVDLKAGGTTVSGWARTSRG